MVFIFSADELTSSAQSRRKRYINYKSTDKKEIGSPKECKINYIVHEE
jgi:hypothetical protein